jgi:hypothetical protein
VKAITVKYIGPTDRRGSRLKAFDSDNNSVTIPYPHGMKQSESHRKAAEMLRDKMGWQGEMISGGTKEGEVFVFLPK